ncbi:hypothetical protein Hdeb2414_s0012g00384271 [Helianthus debilis subsp. tardiflorus]
MAYLKKLLAAKKVLRLFTQENTHGGAGASSTETLLVVIYVQDNMVNSILLKSTHAFVEISYANRLKLLHTGKLLQNCACAVSRNIGDRTQMSTSSASLTYSPYKALFIRHVRAIYAPS